MRIDILGVPFDPITHNQAIETINKTILQGGRQLFIATPNPEMVLEADKNEDFKKILQSTSLNIPDGIGILWAAKYLETTKNDKSKTFKVLKGIFSLPTLLLNPKKYRSVLPERVTGTDLMQKICEKAVPSARIFLLGAGPGVAEKAKKKLESKYNCTIVGTDEGSAHPENYHQLREIINGAEPDILFVAFGAPKQEIWLSRNVQYLSSVKVAIGIGGAFDFVSGDIKRAPQAMQKLGLEWLWRLLRQPSRIKRIFNATIKFPLKVILSRLS